MHLLTSFFLSLLLTTTIHSMEQPLDFSEIVKTCPNEIISHLDGQTLSSLARVSHLLQAICEAVPVKYLSVLFSDAVEHKNTNLVNRFINQLDSWMFTSETDNILLSQEENGSNMIRIFRCELNKGANAFLNTEACFRFTQNNKTVRYIIIANDSYKNDPCMIYLNVDTCDHVINTAFKNAILLINDLSSHEKNMLSQCSFFNFIHYSDQPKHGGYVVINNQHQNLKRNTFSLSSSHPSYSTATTKNTPENMREQFGLITLFLVAARQNNTHVAYAMLNNPKIIDSWSSDILEIVLNDLDSYNEIKDVVAAVLFERKEKTLNVKK